MIFFYFLQTSGRFLLQGNVTRRKKYSPSTNAAFIHLRAGKPVLASLPEVFHQINAISPANEKQ